MSGHVCFVILHHSLSSQVWNEQICHFTSLSEVPLSPIQSGQKHETLQEHKESPCTSCTPCTPSDHLMQIRSTFKHCLRWCITNLNYIICTRLCECMFLFSWSKLKKMCLRFCSLRHLLNLPCPEHQSDSDFGASEISNASKFDKICVVGCLTRGCLQVPIFHSNNFKLNTYVYIYIHSLGIQTLLGKVDPPEFSPRNFRSNVQSQKKAEWKRTHESAQKVSWYSSIAAVSSAYNFGRPKPWMTWNRMERNWNGWTGLPGWKGLKENNIQKRNTLWHNGSPEKFRNVTISVILSIWTPFIPPLTPTYWY